MPQTTTLLRTAAEGISLDLTLACGQSFRWKQLAPEHWIGIIHSRRIEVWLDGAFLCCKGDITLSQLREYFDLDTDYQAMFSLFMRYPPLDKALEYAKGLRILRQDPFEALLTFIFSQQNNIPRITGLVEGLCRAYGEPIEDGCFAFPTIANLQNLTEDDLAPIKSGYRAKYIIDAVSKISDGTIELDTVQTLSLSDAQKYLMQIHGVGIKVAQCALLFGFHRLDALPVDVWIGRAMAHYFPDGFADELVPYAGVAQQYLFHYVRTSDETSFLRPKKS